MTATRITPGLVDAPSEVDVVVIGLGVTGAGVALDAVSRGLSVLAVDAHDLAFGTSRWSSKLVHGGLRYLASGQVGIAHESAVERGILMEVTAPHLTHAMPIMVPVNSSMSRFGAFFARAGLMAGDVLRRSAGTESETLPRPRKLSATEVMQLAPALRSAGLRGGLLSWDGQLEDDARLVTTIARTAASLGAEVRTRARVVSATGTGRRAPRRAHRHAAQRAGPHRHQRDRRLGGRPRRRGQPPPQPRHPRRAAQGDPARAPVSVFAPIPGESNRFVLVLPQPDGTIYVGLTDEPVEGEVPDVPEPTEPEIGFLLDVVSAAFARQLHRSDVIGAYAGLRPAARHC